MQSDQIINVNFCYELEYEKQIKCPLWDIIIINYHIINHSSQQKKDLSQKSTQQQMNRHNRLQRNSTIKQESQQFNNNNLQNDSSISMHEDNDAHYYDLDYSDENINEGIVSSSDQNERQITHQEFMQMIITNQNRHKTSSDQDMYEDESSQQKHYYQYYQQNVSKNIHSAHQQRRHYNKRHTPETRDKSYQLHSYGVHNKLQRQVRNDPQKSSFIKNQIKLSKQTSFNNNAQNSVRQFRIDSFLNAYTQPQLKQTKINKQKRQKRPQIFQSQMFEKSEQDQSFSLITLPEYDQENYSSFVQKENISQNVRPQQNKRNLSKYKDVGKISPGQENNLQKLNWRYQQAKLKFMDTFLPQPLKIGSNSYNMLKYMNKKQQLTYNILMM